MEEMCHNRSSHFPNAAIYDYIATQPSGTVSGIQGVSGELAGLVKMMIVMFGDVNNHALAARMGLPVRVFSAIENGLLSNCDRTKYATENRRLYRGGMLLPQRYALQEYMTGTRFVWNKIAADIGLHFLAFVYEWIFVYGRPFLIRPHRLDDSEQPMVKYNGTPLAAADGRSAEVPGILLGRGGKFYNEYGLEVSNDYVQSYRIQSFTSAGRGDVEDDDEDQF